MALFENETNFSINNKDKKRKNIETSEKFGKKKKKKNTSEFKEESDEVIETVKMEKNKHLQIETKEEPDTDELVVEKVKKKKKKKSEVTEVNDGNESIRNNSSNSTEDTERKPKSKKVSVLPTVTIAVPGSILDNAQSPEFRTYLAGQIARAACIYKIDEVCSVEFLLNEIISFYWFFIRL